MRKVVAVTALAAFGLAPAIGSACEYNQAMASSTPAAQLGLATTATPAATKAPAPVAKAPVLKAAKQVVQDKAPARDAQVAAVSRN